MIEIRRLAAIGMYHRDIAARFGISKSYAGNIVRRLHWKHIR